MKQRYLVVDLETTGNAPKRNDKIIQIGAVLIENGEITERFASFVNPNCSIPPFIEQLTGISNEIVSNAPTFSQIAPMVNEMLEGATFVAHNVPFDLSFLQHEFEENGIAPFEGKAIDTVELARILLPTSPSYKLNDLAELFNVQHENPHRADSDAEVTAHILLKLLDKIDDLPKKTIQKLRKLTKKLKSDVYAVFDHEQRGIQFGDWIEIHNIPIKKLSPIQSIRSDYTFIEKEQNNIPIDTLFSNREHALIEMPSKLKSMEDYVHSGLRFALENQKQVTISVSSYDKEKRLSKLMNDIPYVPYCSKKESSYYLHISRFAKLLHERDSNYDTLLTKAQLLVWLTETETGDVEELTLTSGGRLLWGSINCEYETKKDKTVEESFYVRAQKRQEDSLMIITNHESLAKQIHLDSMNATSDYYIIDESHLFVNVLRKMKGIQITYVQISYLLSKVVGSKVTEEAKLELDELFTMLRNYALKRTTTKTSNSSKLIYKLQYENEPVKEWDSILEAAKRLLMRLLDVIHYVQVEKDKNAHLLALQLKNCKDDLESLLFSEQQGEQTWMEVEVKGAKNASALIRMPVSISETLATNFFQQKSSVVLLSPAFHMDGNYNMVMEELGLSDFFPTTLSVNDGAKKLEVFIPDDMPLIQEVTLEEFQETVAIYLREIAWVTSGKMIVSFSSLEMLQAVYEYMKTSFQMDDIVMLSQSSFTGSKHKLLKAASGFDKAIILVTNQLIEEITLSEENVNTLVIVRLPFKAIQEPLMATKIEESEQKGENSFLEVSLPIAVLRFKTMLHSFYQEGKQQQLIILDRRIIEKKYGEKFLACMNEEKIEKNNFFTLLDMLS
ncbi:exonuclease domain-containing protein [Bacillus sp. FJAT-45066]|uniref:exonuclease domain-containing protein n=1 Tax=Bacillus sp. FJAT-45066 TaxID=2011010 RepID=UPI000BB9495F|nr:exonuclease domain-containing protein [Bacillus sp. FJAT-45066]